MLEILCRNCKLFYENSQKTRISFCAPYSSGRGSRFLINFVNKAMRHYKRLSYISYTKALLRFYEQAKIQSDDGDSESHFARSQLLFGVT